MLSKFTFKKVNYDFLKNFFVHEPVLMELFLVEWIECQWIEMKVSQN